MRYTTISQIGAFTALSPDAGDWLHLDPEACQGGDDAPLRTPTQQVPGGDGVYVSPPLDDAWILTLVGALTITSAGDESGYFAAEDALLASLKGALDDLKTAPDDLVHSGGTLSVWKNAAIVGSRAGLIKTVTFGLIVDVT